MVANGPPFRLQPRLDEENTFFWTSGADGRLRFLRCTDCARYVHPPGPVCPTCYTKTLVPEPVSGRATLVAWTVNHQQWMPGGEPYIVAWVAIAESDDIRLTTNVVDTDPDELEIGMEVEVVFEPQPDDVYFPLFRPVRGGAR